MIVVLGSFLLCLAATSFATRHLTTLAVSSSPFFSLFGGRERYVVWIICLVILVIFYQKIAKKSLAKIPVEIVLGATIYNFAEGLKNGKIVDYLPGFFNLKANLADYLIICGLLITAIIIWKKPDLVRVSKIKL